MLSGFAWKLSPVLEMSYRCGDPPTLPGPGGDADFFLGHASRPLALWGGRGIRRSGGFTGRARPHLRPAILGALVAIHQRHPAEARSEDLLPALRAVVDDGDPPLCRYQAVRALGFLSARADVYRFLVSCLSSPERLVRLGAIESLRGTPQADCRTFLPRAMEETDEEVLQALGC